MNMTATFLAKLISSIYSGYRCILNFLAFEIKKILIERKFFLEDDSLIFLWKLHDIIIMGKGFDFDFKKIKRNRVTFHFININ